MHRLCLNMMRSDINIYTAKRNRLNNTVAFMPVFVTLGSMSALAMLLTLLSLTPIGLDFIDEGYYLNWISNPWIYKFFTTQFGFIYYFPYQLLGENLISLRQFNILFSYALASVLSDLLLRRRFPDLNGFLRITVALLASAASLLILIRTDAWMTTPYYNSLAFQGALVFMLGLLLSQSEPQRHSLYACLIGVGGWLVYMAKPPSAAALALIYVLTVLLLDRHKHSIVNLLIAGFIAVCLLVLTAYAVSGSISAYIDALSNGLKSASLFEAGHAKSILGFFRLDDIVLSSKALLLLAMIGLCSLFSVLLINKTKRLSWLMLSVVLLVPILIGVSIVFGWLKPTVLFFRFYPIALFTLLLACGITLLIKGQLTVSNANAPLVMISFLMPYMMAIGSNNNYWQLSTSASFFWVFSLFSLINASQDNAKLPLNLALISALIFLLVQAILYTSQQMPYNQQRPLSQLNSPLTIGYDQTLSVRKDTQSYVQSLHKEAKKMSFVKGTPAIDLTGHYGMSLHLIGAKQIASPSFFGGYKGSNPRSVFALSQVECAQIANAWLLVEIDGYRSISVDVIYDSSGLRVPGQYEASSPFISIKNPPNSRWGAATQKRYQHYLLKPKSPEALRQTCLDYRGQQS